ncbi:MAG: peptide ABC transporter substrate-binding protein [Patescibacteria group bacterium]|nr:peptide ABC transporter substrate-binding protein [Patescibacteria group bacterium]
MKNIITTFKKKYLTKKHKGNTPGANFDFNKKLVYSLSKSKIPTLKQFKYIGKYLNKKEALAIKISTFLIFTSISFVAVSFYMTHLEITPVSGGEYTEGLIGAPKHINPLYSSINDVDNDISSLIFSSLYQRDSKGGLKEDLLDDINLSEDEKEYTIKIKPNVLWHDGEELSADDLIFTINTIVDSKYQSPLRSSLSGISVSKVDKLTIKISLSQPYAAFKDLLTFGIMPAHLWEQLSPESFLLVNLNLKPIGSGPYKVKGFFNDSSLGKISSMELEINDKYYGSLPYIEKIVFKFFPNFEELIVALNGNLVDGIAYLPKEFKEQVAAQNSLNFYKLNLAQIMSLNFNSKENPFLEKKNTRQALAFAIDREQIVADVFSDNARLAESPILADSFAYKGDIKKYNYDKNEALNLLEKDGWSLATVTAEDLIGDEDEEEKNEIKVGEGFWMTRENDDDEIEYFIVNISTINSIDNIKIAEAIKKYWEEIGVKTIVNEYSSKEINGEIIRNRDYDALLYTQSLSFDPDVYSFWHSSQAVTGGNNISNYFNGEVDRLLSEARVISDEGSRQKMYYEFQDILVEEVPTIFISSPIYTYIQKKDIKNFNVTSISNPSDRFSNISDWYINTGKKIIW